MAPNFFQKLAIKVAPPSTSTSTQRERVSSDAATPRPPENTEPSLRGRAQTFASSSISRENTIHVDTSAFVATLGTSNTLPRKLSNLSRGKDRLSATDTRSSISLETVSSSSPNFTVVPPSPLVYHADLDSDDEDKSAETKQQEDLEDVQPTPTALSNFRQGQKSANTASRIAAETQSSSAMASSLLTTQVKKQPSNRSLKSLVGSTKSAEITISAPNGNHARAATAPADATPGIPVFTTVVDSPTDDKHPIPPVPPMPPLPNGLGASSSTTLPFQREATTSSVFTSDGSKSKRPWRRGSSNTRKPTGLASAIAASGLAMANTSLSATHQAQISPPIISAASSKSSGDKQLPYLSRSPAESSISQKSSHSRGKPRGGGDMSPKSHKSGTGSAGKDHHHRRSRKASSAKSDSVSDIYGSMNGATNTTNGDDSVRQDYSAIDLLDDNSSEEGSDGSGSDVSDGLDMEDDIPVTGFAVASNKRNADFHELFPTVPEGDYLIEDYGCALQREILIQGRIYISENHICFHANIFGWITDLSIPIYDITALEKRMTAFVIPNAIQISTRQSKYTFASFLARDTTFDVIYNIWKLARPEDNISLLSSGRGSIDGPISSPGGGAMGAGGAAVGRAVVVNGTVGLVRKATQCNCGKEGKHYTETAMDAVIPGSPEKIHNLMFASGFIKDFMVVNQKLLDVQMSDWAPVMSGSKLLTRNMSYIKPLNGSLGPKQTKCEIKDEVVFCDFEQYISTVTTTRTPDVPSGGVFSVKTRTCITWASPVSSKVLVTTQVEWTGRSFIKGIIERSAIDGQKVYHGELEKSMRVYIQEHKSEFLPEGVDTADAAAQEAALDMDIIPATADRLVTDEEAKQRERERNARGLQWAWDTFDGAYQVARRSTKDALELIRDAWDQSTSTTILWFVIVILVFSNLWTLMRMGSGREEMSRKLEARRTEEKEKWVQSIVTALWEELSANKHENAVPGQPSQPDVFSEMHLNLSEHAPSPLASQADNAAPTALDSLGWKEEVQNLLQTLDGVEERVKVIRESLTQFEQLNALD